MKVLVIGATSAVAQGVIDTWVDQKADLFLVGRNTEQLNAMKDALGDQVSGVFAYDFTDTDQATEMVDLAKQSLGTIDLVFIAHGFLPDQIASESDTALTKETFSINCVSVLAQIIAITALLSKQGYGKLGVITSVAGERGRPRNYTYGAAKGAVSIYLEGLRSRFWYSGIDIYTFKLGPVDTPMTTSHEKNFSFSTVEQVARKIIKAFDKRGGNYFIPGYWRWVLLAVQVMPEWLFQRLKFLSGR